MSIRAKLIIAFSAIIFLVGTGLFFYLDSHLRSILTSEVKRSLKSVAETSEGSYFVFTENLKTRTVDWSSDSHVKDAVEEITAENVSASVQGKLSGELGAYFREKKMPYDPSIIIVDILDKDGIVIASSREDRIGVNEGEEERKLGVVRWSEAIKGGFGETFITSVAMEEDESDKGMIHVTTRVFSSKKDASGNPIPLQAVMLLHFEKVDELSDILTGNWQEEAGALTGKFFGSIYKSGEIYLIDKNGSILTYPGSEKEKLVLTGKVSEFLSSSCFNEDKEINEEYLNYDGIKVLGATMCIKRDNVILAVEVSSDEIFAPLWEIRKNLIIGFLLTLVLIILSGLLFVATLLRPLQSVIDTAKKVSLKNFSTRANVTSKDEIGYLAGIFNKMLDRIEVFQIEAETKTKKSAEQAASTEKQNKSLEEGKKAMLNILEDARELERTLQSERDKSVAIITSISEGLYVVDRNYKIILINPAAERLFGCKLKECLGKDPRDVISIFKGDELLSGENRPVTRTIKNGESVIIGAEDNFYFQVSSGRKFPVAIVTSPIKTKGLTGAVIVFHDVTNEKLLDEAKSSFISVASHQLRTPLTSIRWYTEMLIDEDVGALNTEQKEFAQQVYDGAARLNETINILLAISRIEGGRLHEDPIDIDLKSFIKNITGELAPLISQKKLSVKVDMADGMQVKADTFMLHEVISNLIANSIRYTDEGGSIAFSCAKGENETTCSVSDNGIGIPDNQKDKIFEKFFRAENAIKKVPDGSGLGLGLVKGFVEKWGGRVWFESIEGKGTTFHFTVPHS